MDIDQREREKERKSQCVCVCVCKTDHANMIKWLEDFAKNAEVFEWDQSPSTPCCVTLPVPLQHPQDGIRTCTAHDHLTSNCSNGQQVQTLPFGTAQYGILCQPVVQAQRLLFASYLLCNTPMFTKTMAKIPRVEEWQGRI